MTFDEAVLRCLSKYAVFAGRARPSEFWWFMALYAGIWSLTLVAAAFVPGLITFLVAAGLALTIPALSVTVRRLHDIGVEGWMLVFLVPVLGQVLLVVWLAKPSVPRLNRHGPEPSKRRERMLLFAR
jgi:uncharacterized membrane protein YhaH (DUF805 family)